MTDSDELLAVLDEFDDIEVDTSGKCHWTHVVVARTHARARLSCLLDVPVASRLHEREKIAQTIWRAELLRATGKERSIDWFKDVSESDQERYRYLADAILASLQGARRGDVISSSVAQAIDNVLNARD